MLTNTNNDEGGEAAPPPPNPRLRILKPGDTIILYDHMISKQHRECTVQKIASSDENVPIKLDDFHLSAMIDHDTRFAIARYLTDDGDSISVDSNVQKWYPRSDFQLVDGVKSGYVPLGERLRRLGHAFQGRVNVNVMPSNMKEASPHSSDDDSSDTSSDGPAVIVDLSETFQKAAAAAAKVAANAPACRRR